MSQFTPTPAARCGYRPEGVRGPLGEGEGVRGAARARRERGCLGAVLEWVDLRADRPWQGPPAVREARHKEADEAYVRAVPAGRSSGAQAVAGRG